jgi:LacI family transcriptional regulator
VISDITNPFFPLAVRGVEAAALQRGYLLTIFNTDDQVDREQQVFSLLRMRGVDGVLAVVAPNPAGKMEHLQELVKREIPLVCLDRVPSGLRVDAVVVDNLKGAAICVRHLISMGHQRIGVISGPSGLQTARDRLKGYKQALREAGIAFDPSLVREGDFRMDSGYRLAKDLLLIHSRPTALFAANGMMGLGTLKAVQEMALRCPEDVALAIFDDIPGADVFRPRLTAVAQPAYELGYKAAELLIQRVTGELRSKEPIVVTLEPELKVRESTVTDPRHTPRNLRIV